MKHYLVMKTILDYENKVVRDSLKSTLNKEPKKFTFNAQTGQKKELSWESDTVDLHAVLALAYELKDSLNTVMFYYMCIDKDWDACYVYATSNKNKEVTTLGTFSTDRSRKTLKHENLELEFSKEHFLDFADPEFFLYIRGFEYIIDKPNTPTSLMIMQDPLGDEVYILYNTVIEMFKDKPIKPLVDSLNPFISQVTNCDSLRQLNETLATIKEDRLIEILKHYSTASDFYQFEESFNKVINNKLKNFMSSVIVEQFVDVFKPLRHRMLDVIEDLTDELKNNEEFY